MVSVLVTACTPSLPGNDRQQRGLDEMADALGADVVGHVRRGIAPGVSAQVAIVPMPHFYLGPQGTLEKLGTPEPETFTAHSSPWNYLVRVPLVLWGPAFVEAGVSADPSADLADVAPTFARWMGMSEWPGRGEALEDGIVYDGAPPRAIFSIVVDGMGWNVLRQYPSAWPNLRRIMTEGMSYEGATIGSSPSITAAIHANIGTGTYPNEHGVPGNPYYVASDPSTLVAPTIGDVWDQRNDNEPIVGTISVRQTHLTMVGHGSSFEGGDRDPAVYWDTERNRWTTAREHFELPRYLAGSDLSDLESYEEALDSSDGSEDDRWFDDDIEALRSDGLHRIATPAFARVQGDAVLEAIAEEPMGDDPLTDLFYVEFKSPDEAGHVWNMLSPQEREVLEEVDRQIGRIKRSLDARIGEGYVLLISADHGQQPLADAVGGWLVDQKELERDLETEFDGDVKVQSYQIFLNDDQDPAEVSAFLSAYTIGDNIPDGAAGAERVPDARRDDLVFAGAFPTGYLMDLTESEIEALGPSEWPEGDYGARVGPTR